MLVLTFFAFLAGVVTILSPCILPVLPIVLSGSVGGKRRPLGVVLGFILSFSAFTLLLSTLVQLLNIPPNTLRYVAVIIILLFGLVLLIPPLQKQFELLASKLLSRQQGQKQNQNKGFAGGMLLGAGLGLVWTPCVGPIMASVISLAISRQVDGGTILIILAYALGTSIPMLGVMLGGRKLIARFPRLSKNTGRIQRVFGLLLVVVALSIGFGLDRRFQSLVLRVFPNYGTGLTALETIKPVEQALEQRRASTSENHELNWNKPPRRGRLEDFGAAPELLAKGPWLNTEGQSYAMEDLKGKVVLLDFWTYSCVNCVRTIPYLQSWYEHYKDYGLVVIGVHSPEFAFEREKRNVEKAIEELGVSWPVVLDNGFHQWRAYNNRYWPAHYFIDVEGRIRYFHFGEGEYENSETAIRRLLEEAGADLPEERAVQEWSGLDHRTPETYLGYGRMEHFQAKEKLQEDQSAGYMLEEPLQEDQWGLQGTWTIRKDYISPAQEGVLELNFSSRHVFLVIEPLLPGGEVLVELDGRIPADTEDVKEGLLKVDESRLYQLIDLEESGEHHLKLEVKGELRLYAFTFG